MRTANPELNKRMRKASSLVAAGTRRSNPELLARGRRMGAVAHIENQLLLGREFLQKEDVQALAEILFGVEDFPVRIVQGSDIPFFDQNAEEEEEPADLIG